MATPDEALQTQLRNIEVKTGQTVDELARAVLRSGVDKHGERVAWVKAAFGLGHGDANTLVHVARRFSAAAADAASDPLDDIYAGAKAALRPIHDALIESIETFGDFETAPKKGYVSLRRKKQFAMLGPKTNTRLELGLNLKDEASHPLIKAEPSGRMCQYIVSLTAVDDIDGALIALIERAYRAAG